MNVENSNESRGDDDDDDGSKAKWNEFRQPSKSQEKNVNSPNIIIIFHCCLLLLCGDEVLEKISRCVKKSVGVSSHEF